VVAAVFLGWGCEGWRGCGGVFFFLMKEEVKGWTKRWGFCVRG